MTIRLLVATLDGADGINVQGFTACGFDLIHAASIAELVHRLQGHVPDAVLMHAEDASAPQTCELLRAVTDVPLIVAGGDRSGSLVRDCLDRGADCVLPLPLSPEDLRAWVRALLRRSAERLGSDPRRQIVVGDLVIDLDAHIVSIDGVPVELTRREFQLLTVLAEHSGRVVEYRELLTRVWGPEYLDDLQNVRQYMGYLRAKLEDDPTQPRHILTVRGVGYRLVAGTEPGMAVAPGHAQHRRWTAGYWTGSDSPRGAQLSPAGRMPAGR